MSPLWTTLAARANVALTDAQHGQLSQYLDLLLAANARMNLTRITDRAQAEIQHVADALTLLPHLPPQAHALADVGSGGGVPGVPLAIARPDVRITLIEATKKKAAFLRDAVAQLKVTNVRVLDQRAEDAGRAATTRESFDVAVARAVATIDWLAEWCLPLLRPDGKMLAMKGPKVSDELPTATVAIRVLGGGAAVVHPVDLPGAEHHVIVEIVKQCKTDPRYPRPATMAKVKPLRA
jgi:16S rRNA (guanine527-N7)-methyltransferase